LGRTLLLSLSICFGLFWFIIHVILTAKVQRKQYFQPTRYHQNISKLQCSSGRRVATISKTLTFEVPQISVNFLPLRFVGFCLWLGPRAAAPEAEHRCIGQAAKATIPWSSGSSRRRRPWMRRTVTVVASEEDLRRNLMRMGFRCQEVSEDVDGWYTFFVVYICSLFVKNVSQKTLANIVVFFWCVYVSASLCLQCTDKTCCIDNFSLTMFWSDHCNPELITNF